MHGMVRQELGAIASNTLLRISSSWVSINLLVNRFLTCSGSSIDCKPLLLGYDEDGLTLELLIGLLRGVFGGSALAQRYAGQSLHGEVAQ
jgi:hypothetical protein